MAEIEKRSEFDTLEVYNPMDVEFVCRFNGELYKLGAKSSKTYPQFLAFHIAKHLSDKLLEPELLALKRKNDESKRPTAYNPRNAQLIIYDNVSRRKTLYNVFRDKELALLCIKQFPFKDFIGNVAEWEEYVLKAETPKEVKVKTPKAEAKAKAKVEETEASAE